MIDTPFFNLNNAQQIMIPKDLLNLIFLEIEFGHDMINFSEIDCRCNQIFNQNLEVVRIVDQEGDPLIYTQRKFTLQHYHGLYRRWWGNGHLFLEENYWCDLIHGQYQDWDESGNLEYSQYYHHGQPI